MVLVIKLTCALTETSNCFHSETLNYNTASAVIILIINPSPQIMLSNPNFNPI